jgi:hypothetical protein
MSLDLAFSLARSICNRAGGMIPGCFSGSWKAQLSKRNKKTYRLLFCSNSRSLQVAGSGSEVKKNQELKSQNQSQSDVFYKDLFCFKTFYFYFEISHVISWKFPSFDCIGWKGVNTFSFLI